VIGDGSSWVDFWWSVWGGYDNGGLAGGGGNPFLF